MGASPGRIQPNESLRYRLVSGYMDDRSAGIPGARRRYGRAGGSPRAGAGPV